MKSNSTITCLILSIAFTCVLCQGQRTTPPASQDTVATVDRDQDSVEFVGYSVHLVKLPVAHEVKDAQENSKQYNQAWLVKFEIRNMPRFSGERIDFAIGDYTIPEYGGWDGGIYFRIYEKELLDKLQAQPIRYQLPATGTMITTDQRFEIPAGRQMDVEDESKVLGKSP